MTERNKPQEESKRNKLINDVSLKINAALSELQTKEIENLNSVFSDETTRGYTIGVLKGLAANGDKTPPPAPKDRN